MRRKFLLALVFYVSLFSAGCWDVEEVNRRAIADSIFLDTGTTKPFRMGISLPVPGTQTPPVNATEQQFEKRNIVLSGEGDSVLDAWTKVQSNVPSDVFFGQIRAVVMSQQAAEGNINDLLEFIGRFPLVPPNTNVLVAKGDPKKLLELKNEANYLPGMYVDLYFQSLYKRTLALPIDLWRVNSILDKKWQDVYLPVVETSQGMLKIAGTAVFSRNRMVGELDMGEAGTLALIRGTNVGYLTVSMDDGEIVSFRNVKSKTEIKPVETGDGTPTFDVASTISGTIVETQPHQEISLQDQKKIQRRAEAQVKRDMERLLSKLQGWNSDPVGFGGKYRIAYPHKWGNIDWHRVYPSAKFNVNTDFRIKATGLFR